MHETRDRGAFGRDPGPSGTPQQGAITAGLAPLPLAVVEAAPAAAADLRGAHMQQPASGSSPIGGLASSSGLRMSAAGLTPAAAGGGAEARASGFNAANTTAADAATPRPATEPPVAPTLQHPPSALAGARPQTPPVAAAAAVAAIPAVSRPPPLSSAAAASSSQHATLPAVRSRAALGAIVSAFEIEEGTASGVDTEGAASDGGGDGGGGGGGGGDRRRSGGGGGLGDGGPCREEGSTLAAEYQPLSLFAEDEEDDEALDAEEDERRPWYRRRKVLIHVSAFLVAAILLVVGFCSQWAVTPMVTALGGGKVELFRWMYFFSLWPPLWVVTRLANNRLFIYIEKLFFMDALYWLDNVRRTVTRLVFMLLILPWFQVVFKVLWCKDEHDCVGKSYLQATSVVWRLMVCFTLFALANFLKALATKLLSTAFYRTAHFKKVKEALDKEYYLTMLAQPRPRRAPLRSAAFGDAPDSPGATAAGLRAGSFAAVSSLVGRRLRRFTADPTSKDGGEVPAGLKPGGVLKSLSHGAASDVDERRLMAAFRSAPGLSRSLGHHRDSPAAGGAEDLLDDEGSGASSGMHANGAHRGGVFGVQTLLGDEGAGVVAGQQQEAVVHGGGQRGQQQQSQQQQHGRMQLYVDAGAGSPQRQQQQQQQQPACNNGENPEEQQEPEQQQQGPLRPPPRGLLGRMPWRRAVVPPPFGRLSEEGPSRTGSSITITGRSPLGPSNPTAATSSPPAAAAGEGGAAPKRAGSAAGPLVLPPSQQHPTPPAAAAAGASASSRKPPALSAAPSAAGSLGGRLGSAASRKLGRSVTGKGAAVGPAPEDDPLLQPDVLDKINLTMDGKKVDAANVRPADWERLRAGIALKTFTALIRKYKNMGPKEEEARLREARRFAKGLFWNVRGDAERDYVTRGDFDAFFDDKDIADQAFAYFDKDFDGVLTAKEMKSSVVAVFKERKNMAASLEDTDSIVRSLQFGIGVAIHFTMAAMYLLVWGVDILKGFSTFSALVLAFTFVFGNSVRNVYESMLFLFVEHAYDVGDLLEVDGAQWRVKQIDLMYTVLTKGTGERCYYPNTRMLLLPLINHSRTQHRAEAVNFAVNLGVPALTVREMLRTALTEFYDENASELTAAPSVNFSTLEDPLKARISVYWECTFGGNDDRRGRIVKNAVLTCVQTCLARIEVLEYTIERSERDGSSGSGGRRGSGIGGVSGSWRGSAGDGGGASSDTGLATGLPVQSQQQQQMDASRLAALGAFGGGATGGAASAALQRSVGPAAAAAAPGMRGAARRSSAPAPAPGAPSSSSVQVSLPPGFKF